MTSRRSFFTRLAQFAAVIAIAPQIAFCRMPEKPFVQTLNLQELLDNLYDLMRMRAAADAGFTTYRTASGEIRNVFSIPSASFYEQMKAVDRAYETPFSK